MQILDYVIIGIVALGAIIGFFKKFCKSLFGLIGIAVVGIGAAYLARFPMKWFGFISSTSWRGCIAIVATAIVVSAVYGIVAHFLKKPFLKMKFPSILSRIFGMLVAVVCVYAVVSVAITLINTPVGIMVKLHNMLGKQLTNSWIINHVYKHNFFGDWLVELFLGK